MADIIFRYTDMEDAVKKIGSKDNQGGFAGEYGDAAKAFLTQMQSAIEPWEGASKNAFSEFIDGTVMPYISDTVPSVVRGLGDMLQQNKTQMQEADDGIAANIRSSS